MQTKRSIEVRIVVYFNLYNMKKNSSSSATQGARVEANKKHLQMNILVNASQMASSVMRNPILHEAFWDSYTLSMEHKCGMSFWNFLVKRFTMN